SHAGCGDQAGPDEAEQHRDRTGGEQQHGGVEHPAVIQQRVLRDRAPGDVDLGGRPEDVHCGDGRGTGRDPGQAEHGCPAAAFRNAREHEPSYRVPTRERRRRTSTIAMIVAAIRAGPQCTASTPARLGPPQSLRYEAGSPKSTTNSSTTPRTTK